MLHPTTSFPYTHALFADLTPLQVTLPDRFIGKGNAKAQQSAMKLTELGPRLTLEIFKVEQGVNEGDVLYHKFVQKTPAEAAQIKAKVRLLLMFLLLQVVLLVTVPCYSPAAISYTDAVESLS